MYYYSSIFEHLTFDFLIFNNFLFSNNKYIKIEEKPVGTYLNLVNDETYFVIVEESSEEAQKYEAKQKLIIEESAKKAAKFLTSDDDDLTMPVETRRKEGCSCLYGKRI